MDVTSEIFLIARLDSVQLDLVRLTFCGLMAF